MSKNIVNNVISGFENRCSGPLQLSKEWFTLREKGSRKRGRIGGSDMSSLLGCNPYRSRKELMKEKQGFKKRKFGNQFPLLFGTVFEEVAVICFEKAFNTKIMCKNISIVDPKGYDYMIFSPDGLCALPVENGEIYLDYDDEHYNEIKKFVPVLIEIKCPTRRELVKDDVIPELYYPQVQAGLLSIDIAHAGIFIDNQIRVCSFQQLYNDNDTDINNAEKYGIHCYCRAIKEDQSPVYIGAILVYGNLPQSINKQYLRTEKISDKNVYDLGNATLRTFIDVLQACRDNTLRIEYLDPCDTVDTLNIVDKIKSSEEENIGIICWKLFDVSYTLVNKNLEYIQKIVSELDKYHKGEFDISGDIGEAVAVKKKDTFIPKAPDLSFDSD